MSKEEYGSDSEVEVEEEEVVEEEVVEEVDNTLTNPDVITKYQEAAKIAQAALIEINKKIVVGASVYDICVFGDAEVERRAANIFKNKGKNGKTFLKGVAFPTCISVNEIVCHSCPAAGDDSFGVLSAGDVVKVDMGVHIDGFIALVAHTTIVEGESNLSEEEMAVRKNVVNAAYTACEVAVRLMKPGNKNNQVTKAIAQVAEAYGVQPIAGTSMHQVKQYVIDGAKSILMRDDPEHRVDECSFETGDVWALDIALSSGDGKVKDHAARTTVFKRHVDRKYALKSKTSRAFFNELNQRFPTLPFTLRAFDNEKEARLGLRECLTHELVGPYPVLTEKKGDFVAHVKVTVMLLPSGNSSQITGLAPQSYIEAVTKADSNVDAAALSTKLSNVLPIGLTVSAASNVTLPEEIVEVLSQAPVESKKKAKKAKKAAAAAAAAAN